ncbi:chaplin [Streptomyces halobius]|uniref:Chaplin n=1 Tax=Streptomyces halobius TaxID=2879846 RepID=A0ABY4MEK5_9ACTN|nr:chaplin [Streptomyces halobius]UQA96216.1 chaplin [Streptomyces halobius]
MKNIKRAAAITMAAGGLALAGAGVAAADAPLASGQAAGSAGVLSGNNVQAPVDASTNACGNTVNGVGLLNPTGGQKCANYTQGGAEGQAVASSGVGSGNNVQIPVHTPVNTTGNSVNIVGLLNPTGGNVSSNY